MYIDRYRCDVNKHRRMFSSANGNSTCSTRSVYVDLTTYIHRTNNKRLFILHDRSFIRNVTLRPNTVYIFIDNYSIIKIKFNLNIYLNDVMSICRNRVYLIFKVSLKHYKANNSQSFNIKLFYFIRTLYRRRKGLCDFDSYR